MKRGQYCFTFDVLMGTELKVDENDSILHFGTKTHQFFLWGFLTFEDARKVTVPFLSKARKEFQTESYRKKSVLNSGWGESI